MRFSTVYAIIVGSSFCFLLLLNCLPLIVSLVKYLTPAMSKYLIYNNILYRHQYFGPWSSADVLVHFVYITEAGLRAGTLSVTNLIPLFGGPHLSTIADLLGLTLNTVKKMHRPAGVTATLLALFHSISIITSRPAFPLSQTQNLFAVIGISSLCCILLFSLPLFQRRTYELFLRAHHALAVLSAYAIWRHLPSTETFPRCYVYIFVCLFVFMCLLQVSLIIYQNGFFRYRLARAEITHEHGAIRLYIHTQKSLRVQAGQYINVWMPSVSFSSVFQSHPFVVISWAAKAQDCLELFIQPRRGFTRELLSCTGNSPVTNALVVFSGPHGRSIPMDDSENILLVASGFGIAAHLPYLKQLIHGSLWPLLNSYSEDAQRK
ncbi:hypothetical protein CC78DRAFT_551974 [Lojkania enalia]|uniref:FAD-binding FR-type domain-containing protein n=1 Tax=Lojkania enalia TaxID=147567 RepID=A0A9P4KEM4_9PLEO|nr:hypothetical protein CC78DRAFT_551974 [Didymosphaeria enalia]